MPAIRDFTFAYETLTTDAGITVPMCNYQQNDLLLVFAMADTGAGTWGCAGYTQLFARNNTCSAVCYYKIAGESEGAVVVTNTVTETYNGIVIAIRDVNTTNPFGSPAVQTNTTQAAAARFSMDTITTSVADSMVICFSASSGTTVPCFIEGIVQHIGGGDGAAESMGVGWFMKRATGVTPTITCSNVGTTGAGVKATIQIAPPSGGATVIPAYTASDSSTFLEFLSGTTGFNANTAMAATADTGFGTSLGGITANDAVVAASPDVGLNSFHSFARLTNAATANQISGAELVFAAANRPNIGTKNILCHVRPQTPGQYQRLAPITSTRGVWFGVRSNAASGGATTGYKIWKVHGTGTNWPQDGALPVVINSAAGNTTATSGTLDTAVAAAMGFWVSSIGALQSGIEFGVAWLMDVTSICGGNASEPLGVSGVVSAAGKGHERLSCLQQGANQMLCVQDLQIGDGGTNSVFLDLDSTAIEFPRQYDVASKDVYYNSTDNKVGITYYAGASDTIKHRNSVVSSASRYKWGLHASSSTSATYDFSGLSVIGAGTISLARAITVSELTIKNYSTLDVTNAVLVDCTITSVPATNDSVTLNSSTSFTGCAINVSAVTSGNRWLSIGDPSVFVSCAFVGGGGHAIRITTPGAYTFTGNSFASFGATGTNSAAIYNDSGGTVTLNIAGGGGTPTYRNGASATTVVNNAVTVKVTVKDANTLAAIQDARVYLTAIGAGPSPDGTVLLSGISNAGGIVQDTGFNYLGNQSVTGRVRRATSGTLYKTGTVTGTITSAGLDTTILLISDE